MAGESLPRAEPERNGEPESLPVVVEVSVGEVDGHLDGDRRRVVREHEVLDGLVALRGAGNRRDHERGHLDRAVPALRYLDPIEAALRLLS